MEKTQMTLSDKEIESWGSTRYYYSIDVKKAIKELKEKINWGKNHGNGDMNSTKAVISYIDEIFGRC